MLPIDSVVRTGKVTEAQLLKWLEKELNNVFAEKAENRFGRWVVKFKGMEVTFNAFGPEGRRVQSVTVAGKPLETGRAYSVLACEREGDPEDMLCRMKNVKEAKNTAHTLHSALTDYLKANSPVTPTPKGNAVALDAPKTLLSQVTGVDYQFI
jgi:S-sulfosulfanyl-L-cysteine sulfohydrolase